MIPPKRGRPVGTEDSATRLLQAELIAHLKLYKSIREVVQQRITTRSTDMDADELGKFMDLLRRGIGDMTKALAPTKESNPVEETPEDSSELLERLLGGAKV